MNEHDLNQALRSLAVEHPRMPRADAIERELLAAYDECHRPRRPWLPGVALAMAASLAAVGFFHDRAGREHRAPDSKLVFIAIPYTIPPAPYERTTIMRMDVEVGALIAAGFQVHEPHAGASVPADVLFAQDGRAVAIRPLTIPIL
jgi:hypothetical protein